VAQQSKTPAAENAIKLTVYKTDAPEEVEVAQPEESVPVKRETAKPAPAKADDVTDVLKKWTKK
jgi:hypothetical protein